MPEITVDILHPVWIDDLPEDVYGIIARMNTPVSPSGEAYVAFIVKRLDDVGESQVAAMAHALSNFVKEPERVAEYRAAIEPTLLGALARAA